MATANYCSNRLFTSDNTLLKSGENRIDSLLNQAHTCINELNDLQNTTSNNNLLRQFEINNWSLKMTEKIDESYQLCSNDLTRSLRQLELFQQKMINMLNNPNESHLDGKKLLAIEHEICILKCLTYQLDTTKIKLEGKLKLYSGLVDSHGYEISIDDKNGQNHVDDEKQSQNFQYRILIHQDILNKIKDLSFFQQSVKMTTNDADKKIPERVLTIIGKLKSFHFI